MRTTDLTTGWPRWTLTAVSMVAVAGLAACGSSSSKQSTSAASASGSPSATASATATGPITSAALYSKLKMGASSLTSAHITMSVRQGHQTALTAKGDETMANGKVTSMSLNEEVGSLNMQFRIVKGGLYIKLPSNLNQSGKPWVKASKGSTNPLLRQLSTSMSSVAENGSVGQYASFASSGSVKTVGVEQVNGSATTHYLLMVEVTKVHSAAITASVKQALAKAGVTRFPVDLWVDDAGHPLKVSEELTLQGQAVTTTVNITQLNQTITITAPPANQVSTS